MIVVTVVKSTLNGIATSTTEVMTVQKQTMMNAQSLIDNIVAFDAGLGDNAAEISHKFFLRGLEDGVWVNSSCIVLSSTEILQHLVNTLDIDAPYNELPLSWELGATPPLHAFAMDNLIGHVSLLLDHGIDIEERDKSNRTVLHIAAQGGMDEIVSLLMDRSAETNVRDAYGCSPLHRVAWYGHFEIAHLLLQHGAQVNAMNHSSIKPIEWAIVRNQPEIFDLFRGFGAALDNFKVHPIFEVVRSGCLSLFTRLVAHGVDLLIMDRRANTLVHIAVMYGREEIAELIIRHFAAVASSKLDAINDDGLTALMIAAQKNNLLMIEQLLSAGSSPNVQSPNNRQSALLFTIKGRNVEVIRTLLDYGANVNHQNGSADTLLHLALRNRFLSVVKLLVTRGADRLLVNNFGETPVSIAAEMCIDL